MITQQDLSSMLDYIGSPIILVDVDPDGHFGRVRLNSLAEELYEVTNEYFASRDLEDLSDVSDTRRLRVQRAISEYRRCIELGSQITTETEIKTRDGAPRWAHRTIVPIFTESGEIRQLMITAVDITEFKKTQQQLEDAMTHMLSGFVTICATCKKIRNDKESWLSIEEYAAQQMNFHQFSHGLCPNCFERALQ